MLSINIQVINNLGTRIDEVWLYATAPDDAALISVTAKNLAKALLAHSLCVNFFSFHRRTKEKSTFCRGMWPSDTDEAKN